LTLSYVVDSSLIVDALSVREGDEVLRQRLSAPRALHAPHHLDVEVASTVRGLAAGQKISDRRAEQMLADYARLRITRHPVWPYHPRMWELRHNLGAYDAAYIALAEALGYALLTGDVKLKKADGHHASVIVSRQRPDEEPS
jgi:predicted nucleic acid-binding protein